jgi:hypothetical protein
MLNVGRRSVQRSRALWERVKPLGASEGLLFGESVDAGVR